ncbi:MAG: 4'-phosphopantetheinyl transferase superfamily protein [Arachidicoccus sp.]|nr:4'-phosphopantetheinyl transferase superfamily protein [Arachidicoccus sp.]
MTSIGNDIVSLKSERSGRFAQKEYYSKILSPYEEALYHRIQSLPLSFKDYVWLLWTIKESVFKFYKRNNSELLFHPQKIVVKNINEQKFIPDKNLAVEGFVLNEKLYLKGTADLNDNLHVFFSSILTEDFIFTITSSSENSENLFSGIKQIKNSDYSIQSSAVRNFIMNKLQSVFPLSFLEIKKNNEGIPVLIKDGRPSGLLISFSHHERWIAYSFENASNK